MSRYISRAAADGLHARYIERLAEIQADYLNRILARVRAGHDPRIAATEEQGQALGQLDAAAAAFDVALDALPTFADA